MHRIVAIASALIVLIASWTSARADSAAAIAARTAALTPQNRAHSFQAMDTMFPYHEVPRGGPIAALPGRPHPIDLTYTFRGKRRTLDGLLARTHTLGFLVVKDGRVADERYFGGATARTRFTSWSVGKSFTSSLVGLALADGKIKSLDDPVTEYLPELKGSGYDGVPIKDLLEMSSGVKFNEVYANPNSDVVRLWNRTMVEHNETIADFAKSLGREEKPGTKFVYRSIDTAVLGMLLRRVTGQTLAAMLSERIWKPLGMEQSATWLTAGSGPNALEAAYCCLNATVRDYARFGLLFLNGGKAGGKQIVPESWVTAATNPDSPQVGWGRLEPGDPGAYGYQWWLIAPGPKHAYSAEGVFFQFIYVAPQYNMVIVKTSAADDAWNDALGEEQFVAFKAIGRALSTR